MTRRHVQPHVSNLMRIIKGARPYNRTSSLELLTIIIRARSYNRTSPLELLRMINTHKPLRSQRPRERKHVRTNARRAITPSGRKNEETNNKTEATYSSAQRLFTQSRSSGPRAEKRKGVLPPLPVTPAPPGVFNNRRGRLQTLCWTIFSITAHRLLASATTNKWFMK